MQIIGGGFKNREIFTDFVKLRVWFYGLIPSMSTMCFVFSIQVVFFYLKGKFDYGEIPSILTVKSPIKTAADDKFCNIFPNSRKKRYDIS